ncbi:hypothetical protein CDD83_8831 [Cordyceps sp. RAO-2017]|nr:hypothetical protein CDD83_8831 [Cordyceps sp. RAO-2017]
MRRAAAVACIAALPQLTAAGLYPGMTAENHTCALFPDVLSCSPDARPDKVKDTCCAETYGGLLVATQIWDTFTGRESEGQVYPRKAWTIHGLWPDFCNGSYPQYCDLSRQYDPSPSPNTTDGTPGGTPVPAYEGEPIERWFADYGRLDLLAYMRNFWVSRSQPNWAFWAHEFSKHATCFSTFQKECYGPQAAAHADLFDFFETAVALHRPLRTHRWLARDGIRPSNGMGYSLARLQHVLTAGFGREPLLLCAGPRFNETAAGRGSADAGRTHLAEVWYYLHVHGRPQRGRVQRLDARDRSNCAEAEGAVWYRERAEGSERRAGTPPLTGAL